LQHARDVGYDTLLIDTAGRLHIDDELMEELVSIKSETHPVEILFVADAMTGQDAVRSAEEFHRRIGITGVVLTKMDGDARGGAALSIKQVIGQPVKFVGVGEKYDALEPFYPDRVAQRILGMGDVLSLIEQVHDLLYDTEPHDDAPWSVLSAPELLELEGIYTGCAQDVRIEVTRKSGDVICNVMGPAAPNGLPLVMAQTGTGQWVMKTDARHLSVGWLREPSTHTPCLMLGLNTFRKIDGPRIKP